MNLQHAYGRVRVLDRTRTILYQDRGTVESCVIWLSTDTVEYVYGYSSKSVRIGDKFGERSLYSDTLIFKGLLIQTLIIVD